MAELSLEIITPSKALFSGSVKSVTIPGTAGSFQVLVNHAPIISTFEIGLLTIQLPNKDKVYYSTSGGTVEVLDNKVLVLADAVEQVENIDIHRAKSALERAKERLGHKDSKEVDITRAELALARAINRINIAEKYGNRIEA
ncbi:MAG: F0F1 ATP synthase subunit epsilon [Ignavibacteriaceae bacterium]